LSLDPEDLRLRFGYRPTEYVIENYVTGSWARKGDRWFGIYHAEQDGLVATLHVATIDEDAAEFGFTVSKDQRKKGIGDTLFKRGVLWAKARDKKNIFMHCLSENQAIKKIAKNNSMHVVTLAGGESEADLVLKSDPNAAFNEAVADKMAVYDMLLVNQQKFWFNIFRKTL
jgi:GNAT superfamily N-acetyltransferase